jgi:hypothetical protein
MLANHAPASNDSPQGDSDYEIILSALKETARGRSFLRDYALRSRATDTATLLTAIERIEGLLKARDLEAVEPPSGHAATAPDSPENPTADTIVTGIAALETSVRPDSAQEAGLAIKVAQTTLASISVAEIDGFSIEVAELRGTAIEFLGPEPLTPSTSVELAPARPNRKLHDPFADFRGLSNEETIAIFT